MDYNDPNQYGYQQKPTNGLAIASMILGIVSIVFGLCYGVGIVFGIISLVFAIISKKASEGKFSGMALAGLICSIIGIVISIVVIVFLIFSIAYVSEISQSGGYDNIYDFFNSLENY